MSNRDELIHELHEEINRCKLGKLDSRKENDMGMLPLAALNTRLTEYDKRIATAEAELARLQAEPVSSSSPDASSAEVEGERWDVFISYQRESETEAREVLERLTAAGLRVWQDVNNIRHTDLWPMAIDSALTHSDRLVLLLTPDIRQSNEVFNEWFYFYQQRKPIHCLMVETCVPHYQLLPYQYLDWRDPASRDWERLLRELRTPFEPPDALTPSPIVRKPDSGETTPVSPFADLLQAARDPNGSIALTEPQIKALAAHKPADRIPVGTRG